MGVSILINVQNLKRFKYPTLSGLVYSEAEICCAKLVSYADLAR